jgi:hypothetical protein
MKNWKTTLFGALLAIAVALQPLLTTGSLDWKAIVIAALIAAIGYFAKDAGVTGKEI